jgi:hypothetical protein
MTAPPKPRTRPKLPAPLEREVRYQIEQWLTLKGWKVYRTEQGYRKDPGGSRTTAGIPDLYVMRLIGRQRGTLWIEVKRPGEHLRPEQRGFGLLCAYNTVPHLVAHSLDDVRRYLGDL